MRVLHFLLIGSSALTVLVSCGDMVSVARINQIGLSDYSASVSDSVFNRYLNVYYNSCYTKLQLQDITLNMPIDEASENESSKIFYQDFADQDFLGNDHIVTHAQDSIDARFSRFKQEQKPLIYSSFLKTRRARAAYNQNTDILRSLLVASKYVIRDSSNTSTMKLTKDIATGNKVFKTTNLIIINSDMVNDEPGPSPYDMDNFAPLSHKKICSLLDSLQKESMIANLKGCLIIVNGATAIGKNSNKLFENVQYFWSEYFKRAGATLLAYGFDTSFEIDKFFKDFKR